MLNACVSPTLFQGVPRDRWSSGGAAEEGSEQIGRRGVPGLGLMQRRSPAVSGTPMLWGELFVDREEKLHLSSSFPIPCVGTARCNDRVAYRENSRLSPGAAAVREGATLEAALRVGGFLGKVQEFFELPESVSFGGRRSLEFGPRALVAVNQCRS